MKIKVTSGDLSLCYEDGCLAIEDTVTKDFRDFYLSAEQVYAVFAIFVHPDGNPSNSDELYELLPKDILELPQNLRPIP